MRAGCVYGDDASPIDNVAGARRDRARLCVREQGLDPRCGIVTSARIRAASPRTNRRDQISHSFVFTGVTAPETDLVKEMRARVRRHMLVSFAGIGLAILTVAAAGSTAERFEVGSTPRMLFSIAAVLGLLLVPIIGFWSTFKSLRCPGCDGFVGWQVSWNYSLFSNAARKTCQHCDARIFPDGLARRFLVMVVIALSVGFIAAIVNVLLTA